MHDHALKHIGYIGLGIMGRGMAANLLKAGFQLTVWNRTAARSEALRQQGAAVAASPAALAEAGPQVICINVSDTPDVEEVLFARQGVATGARRGLIVVDHSTISPTATQRFAAKLTEQDVTLLDAPVSGGDVGARDGTLSIMVGGDRAAFDFCKPMFDAVGKTTTLLGPAGSGQLCKACNQVAVVSALMGVCEAMALARKGGLDVEAMIKVVSGGAGGSWQLANLGPRIARGDHAPGFMIDLVLKDLRIVHEAATEMGLTLDGLAAAAGYFQHVRDAVPGGGRLGTQAMAKALEQRGDFRF